MPGSVGWKWKADAYRHATGSSMSKSSPREAFAEWCHPPPRNSVECGYFYPGNAMATRAFDTDLRRGIFSQFTTENIYCSKKIHVARFLTRRVPLGSGLWHNTDVDISGAFPQVAEGCPSC